MLAKRYRETHVADRNVMLRRWSWGSTAKWRVNATTKTSQIGRN
jgi:hypothetical protein